MGIKHYVDNTGTEISVGFYLDSRNEIVFVESYFERREGMGKVPNIFMIGRKGSCDRLETINWKRIQDPQQYLKKKRNELLWMQQKISPLEQKSKSEEVAQSQPKCTETSNTVNSLPYELAKDAMDPQKS